MAARSPPTARISRPTTSSTPRPAMSCCRSIRAARPPTAQEFANLIHHAYPGNDYDDLMSAVDAAIAQGYRRSRAAVRHRRLGRRRAHRLDRRPDQPLPRRGDAEAGDRLVELRADRRQSGLLLALLVRRDAVGGSRRPIGAARRCRWSATSRRRPWSWSAARITARRSARPSNIIRRCSCAACRRLWSKVPGRAAHGGLAARPSQSGAKAARSSPGSNAIGTGRRRSGRRRAE